MAKPVDAFYIVGTVPTEGLTVTINIYNRDAVQTIVKTASMLDNGGGHYSYLVPSEFIDGHHKFVCDGGSGITNNLERYKYGFLGS